MTAPCLPIVGIHASARISVLVKNGASAMMNSANEYWTFLTLTARKYATG